MDNTTDIERSHIAPLDRSVHPLRHARSRHAPLAPTAIASGTSSAENLEQTIPPRPRASDAAVRGDMVLYLLLAALIAAAWQITQIQLIDPNEDAIYWIGVGGGSMMLLLFVYPLRKHLRVMQGLGKVKWWFWLHLALGIGGPWLILVHARFQVGSLNAGVALYSMCVVVCSGVIGRFLHVRIHRGLDGERTSLNALRARAGLVETNARSRLHFAPEVEARLLAFEQRELHADAAWSTHLRQVTLLPLQQWITGRRCLSDLRQPLRQMAKAHHWSASDLRRRRRRARRLVDQYLDAVVRVAQFTAYERVFALWHMAHLPFIYLLVLSAVVHVIAVHAY